MKRIKRKSIVADEYIDRIYNIDIRHLQEEGRDKYLVDLDNTLVSWGLADLSPRMIQWVKDVRSIGGDVCIVSNTASKKRIASVAEKLGVIWIRRAHKPKPHGFLNAADSLNAEAFECVVVGDKLVTDILGGNMLGMYTVHVIPLSNRNYVLSKVSEWVERMKEKWRLQKN